MYIGIHKYADVSSMSEYIHCDVVSTSDKHTTFFSDFPYSERIGSLLHLVVVSRPDIICAVDVLTRHLLKHPTYMSCKAA